MFYLITDFEYIKTAIKLLKYTMVNVDIILLSNQLTMTLVIVAHLHIKK